MLHYKRTDFISVSTRTVASMQLSLGVLAAAVPFGWGLGVVAAHLMAGHDFGQLLALTVPLCIVAAVAFALSPLLTPGEAARDLALRNGTVVSTYLSSQTVDKS
jgi:hypothetical protein